MRAFVCLLLTIVIFSSCASAPERSPLTQDQPSASVADGMRYLEEGDFEKALASFDRHLQTNPISSQTLSVTFFSGLALENLGRFTEAEEKFKTTLRLSEGKDPYMEAESLFHLGKTYEGIGRDDKALASFLDATRRARYLRREVGEVELPARIGSVYSRQMELETAELYYRRADAGLQKLRPKTGQPHPEWMPRALYSMGKISPRTILASDFESGLKSLRRSQSYLLRSLESQHRVWSEKAAQEIEAIYQGAWNVIETLPLEEAEDQLLALKKQQAKMIEMGLVLHGALAEIKQDLNISTGKHSKDLLEYFDGYTKRLDALLASRPANEGLTPEGQRFESIRREGRVIDPAGALEKKKKRLSEKLPSKREKK